MSKQKLPKSGSGEELTMPVTWKSFGLKCFALIAAISIAAFAQNARGDDYPSHPIKLIVPYAPGGAADAIARIIGKRVSETIGQPVVVENRSGAGSILGTEDVHKADPDGYTLLLGQSGPIAINPGVYKELPYDPERDFAPITMTTDYPYMMTVNAKLPVKTVQDFVAMVKGKPGEFNYGTTGVGSANQLVTELFSGRAGLKMTHVPYRGTALAVADLLAGQVTVVFSDPVSALPHLQAGTLRALAVTTKERSAVAPDVPTLAESGYPRFDTVGWHGFLAPAKTPQLIIQKLHDQIVAALADPPTKALIVGQAMQIIGDTPAEFAAFIKQDITMWKGVATQANVSVK
ncbi:MAG TPA: tripartite tricarboxylate transporter substrate binding protein [Xanthobacteraceae bacterium]|jgi:tripartite-type tricarboxylate transporter receptor subunit TctC|nr:tripartite tricarboxylate transporter substrate binding protein [Xanthobacteraceae bacterium]